VTQSQINLFPNPKECCVMKVPSVLVLFAVALFAAGCAKPTPRELFERADKAEAAAVKMLDSVREESRVRSAFAPALEAFDEIAKAYPADSTAEVALFRAANIRNNYTGQSAEAVDGFKAYAAKYPNGRQTETAMFLIGFIYNNSLHQIDSAGAAYRKFLEKYPDSQYATAARFELSTLGKKPEELLPAPEPFKEPVSPVVKRKPASTGGAHS
jgi:outer membrane protein assembly factor BamD (BamD/ComL family)